MSAAIHSVRTIRNAALESNLTLREQTPAERDEMRRSESFSESIESLITPLTARQMHAINLLSMGKTVVATARSLDIGVSTLHRWKATHPLFKAELAQRQHNLFDAMIQKLRLTMSKAVDNLFEMMNSNMKSERKEVTHAMLKLLRPQKFLVPSEPMSAQAVLDEAVREMRASRGESMSEEITEEERIAAIPAEFRVREELRVQEEIKHQGHGGHEGNAGREECGEREGDVRRDAHGKREAETASRSRTDECHAERSEASAASEQQVTSTCGPSPARRVTTPLPSREGPGEGAASDEVDATDEGAGDAAGANRRYEKSAKAADVMIAKFLDTDHVQPTLESVIASRPLPQHLPQGEGSQSAPIADHSVATASIGTASSTCADSIPAHLGQFLREYAQDDDVCKKRHVERNDASPLTNDVRTNSPATTTQSAKDES